MTRTSDRIAATLPYLMFLLLGFGLFPSAGYDDSHISFWPVYTLREWGEILNYNGDRVEQSSTLLFTLLLWPLAELLPSVSIVTLGCSFSIACGLLTIYLTGQYSGLQGADRRMLQYLLVLSVPFLYWSFGGMETSLAACTMLLFLMAWLRFGKNPDRTGVAFLSLATMSYLMVRPEAVFVLSAFYLGTLTLNLYNRTGVRRPLAGWSLGLLLFALLAGWRLWYFGDWLPQPVTGKIGPDVHITDRLILGSNYLARSILQTPSLAVFAVTVAAWCLYTLRSRPATGVLISALLLTLAQLGFAFFVGGDWMAGSRFLAPVMAPAVYLAWRLIKASSWPRMMYALMLAAQGFSILWFAHFFSTSIPAHALQRYQSGYGEEFQQRQYSFFERASLVHLRDIPFLNRVLPQIDAYLHPGQRRTVMSVQAGMVIYHLAQEHFGQIEFVDAKGLSTRHLSQCTKTMHWSRDEPVLTFQPNSGIFFTYTRFFDELDSLESVCNLSEPDMIFELSIERWNEHLPEELTELGYWTFFQQHGVVNLRHLPQGRIISLGQFFAVNNRLLLDQWPGQ